MERIAKDQLLVTFINCGVTSRTVATRQACSSSDAWKVLGDSLSKSLLEDVGTERRNQNSQSISTSHCWVTYMSRLHIINKKLSETELQTSKHVSRQKRYLPTEQHFEEMHSFKMMSSFMTCLNFDKYGI